MEKPLEKTLKDAAVKFIRVIWCDNANVIRAKAAHINFLQDAVDNGIGITVAQQALPVMADAVVPESGLGPVGEVRLMPDWSTLKVLPFAPGHAQVLSDMVAGPGGELWDQCPRGFLKHQYDLLKAEGFTLKVSFENEFFLLHRNEKGALVPADDTIFCATGAMNQHRGFISDLADALNAQGVSVEAYYPESGPGQQEVTYRYTDAAIAADNQIVYRETVRGVAFAHGLIASFLPKIAEDKAGSGCHINFSLYKGDDNISGDAQHDNGIGPEAAAFVGGILDHLPGLCALTIPSKTSYRRIRPHFWAGAFRVWGYDNREAAVRVLKNAERKKASRFEYKAADATGNPYLALGAIVAAGLDGLRRGLSLPDEVTMDPGLIPEEERRQKGIDLLPQNLGEAIRALRNDAVLTDALGPGLGKSFIAVRQKEWEVLKGLTLEEEVALLAERY